MYLPNFYKRLLLVSCITLLPLSVIAQQSQEKQQAADKTISRLYHSLDSDPRNDMQGRIVKISSQFLNRPYLLGALGEGPNGKYDQEPLYRLDAFDCETYVDTVLGLALANGTKQFKRCINQVRYFDGRPIYTHRNHFTCLDWNLNNQHKGYLRNITMSFHDQQNKPVVKFASAYINKPSWYEHASLQTIRLNPTDPAEQAKRLQELKEEGKRQRAGTSVISYIPSSALFNRSGQANLQLFRQIPNAAIIEIIRPNWDLSKEIGTHLNVSHLGFAIWDQKVLYFRQASSKEGRVLDVPLIDYLRDALKSPTIKGINVQIVLPQRTTQYPRC